MKVYILEDESHILQYIISLVDEIPYLQLVGYSPNIAKAKMEIPDLQPDIILSDIQLEDGNSLSMFAEIQTDAQIIFITAYDQYAIQALNLGALAYLLKPLDTDAFRTSIDKCYQKTENSGLHQQQVNLALQHLSGQQFPKKIALRSADVIEIVNIEDIIYCKGDKGYTTFYLQDNSKILVSKVLKEFENILPSQHFVRCHQSYLIHTTFLKKYYKDGQVEMSNGDIIPVSQRKRAELLQLIDTLF
ncbi:LytTR family DNA-binding domain-containing protein [Flavobacterium sp. CBA20B-1]|uniref:LytR/AlgR family response regulator transcription factor n=1 Tax=unclassified Flavobacterium TaxID=196869 RepID=UPI002225A16E|nr:MULTISPECIES: LytTR family DNA-binding domain-containing protein [unclassified Flavobacterium]WCM42661.1 LytTR family DNA-binding domain-containing protein [Flavobacterium sp. CBA20B-1]